MDQCLITRGGLKIPLKCRSVAFANHPHNASLLKEVKVQDTGKTKYVPLKTFPYESLKTGITNLVSDPNYWTLCDHRRKRNENIANDILADIYDGAIWQDFNSEKYSSSLEICCFH